jgi:MFS family permease
MIQINKIKLIPWYREYGWQLVVIMLLGSIVNYTDRVNLSFVIIHLQDEFNLNHSQSGFLLAAWMWPYAFMSIPSGWLIDKFGINKIFIWSVVLWSIATILSGVCSDYQWLYFSRVCLGIAEAPFFMIGAKILQLYFKDNKRGLAASVINLGPKIANGLSPILITVLILSIGWRWMFVLLGVIGFLIVALWLKVYKKDDAQYQVSEVDTLVDMNARFSIWKLINHKTSWWINLGNFGSSYVFWLYFTWLPTYLMDKRGLDLKAAGFIAALPFIAGIIAVPIGGYISDLLVKRYNFSVIKARVLPAVIGCIIAGVSVIPINYVDSLALAVILFSISTFAVSARVGVLWALVSDIAPKKAVGTFGGIQNCANFIGGALAPTISGLVLQSTQNYNIVFGISGVLVILAAFCYAMISQPILSIEIE